MLLIDEVLAVGDAAFRERSAARIDALIGQGTAVLLVTHGLQIVRERADRVLWLQRGRPMALDAPDDVVDCYLAAVGQTETEGALL